jgi:uncharacterized protein YbjT (DUF2867 family)
MRVLVTGGTGFVGCHTVAAQVGQGYQIRPDACADRSQALVHPLGGSV